MLEIWEVLKPFNDPVNFVGSVIGIAGAGVSLLVLNNQRSLRRAMEAREAKGEHYPRVKCQRHSILVGGTTAVLGIVGVGHDDLDKLILGSGMPRKIQDAARNHKGESAIFRMPTTVEQDHMYRDLVGWAGTLIKDGIPRVMTVLCEKGNDVERFLLRVALYTPGELQLLLDADQVVNQAGKEKEWPRIRASKEFAEMVDLATLSETMPMFKDSKGFVVAHWVVPAG